MQLQRLTYYTFLSKFKSLNVFNPATDKLIVSVCGFMSLKSRSGVQGINKLAVASYDTYNVAIASTGGRGQIRNQLQKYIKSVYYIYIYDRNCRLVLVTYFGFAIGW